MKNPMSQINFLFFTTLMAILIWMASPSVKAAPSHPLPLYDAQYTITWHGIEVGTSTHRLTQKADGHYYFEAKTKPRIKILPYQYYESAEFSWQNDKIKPYLYHCNILEGKRRKVGDVHFDWAAKKITHRLPNETLTNNLKEGMQDKVTQTFSIRQALKKNHTALHYEIAELDKIKPYTFTVLGKESLNTNIGVLETLKIKHISSRGHETVMWLDPKRDYLPVKVTQSRNGKVVATGTILNYYPLKG